MSYQITDSWPGGYAVNESYNARIDSGGAVTFGFTASGSPSPPAPITLNGVTCS